MDELKRKRLIRFFPAWIPRLNRLDVALVKRFLPNSRDHCILKGMRLNVEDRSFMVTARRRRRFGAVIGFVFLFPLAHSAEPETIEILSSKDKSMQKALFLIPKAAETAKRPLLVHLHSWSAHYNDSDSLKIAMEQAEKQGWIFISPEFRGPNDRPEAGASPLAIADVLDAVKYAEKHAKVDRRYIYLLGGSGGGHMALMMAAVAPKLWTAVSAWVPITDLADWHAFSKKAGSKYAEMMEAMCGGPPSAQAECYKERSPLFRMEKAKGLRIQIEVGIEDGHKGAVPVRQSLWAFNALVKANGWDSKLIPEDAIAYITDKAKIPEDLAQDKPVVFMRKFPVLFYRQGGPVELTIFDGGHATDFVSAVRWLDWHK